MNPQDFLNAVRKHQPCTSRELYLPLLGMGYYSNKTESEAIEHISKHADYLRRNGFLVSEKQSGSFGVRNVWSVKPTEAKEEPDMNDPIINHDETVKSVEPIDYGEEMASDIAEIKQEPARKFITRVTRITVSPKGDDIFSDKSTHIEIDDEGGGEFLKIMQVEETFSGIRVDVDEWPVIAEAIDMMIEHIQANEQPGS